jgi:SAM-dependent methyltransferase
MTPEQLTGYERRELDETFFYSTRYGTPVAFVRPLELLGQAGVTSVDGLKLLDFGFGTIGQLRALASAGAQVTGVEVDPLLQALYSQPGDTGTITRCAAAGEGRDGRLTLVFGRWPAEPAAVEQAGGDYDLVISKNTLKRGYIHPERPVDPRRLVQLGVDDEAFVRAVFALLKPGGFALIYNLCPAPAPDDQPYIPWADGRCPFARELCEQAGFEVAAFDVDDTPAARAMGAALGWGTDMDLEADLFGTYTLLRRPAEPPARR